MSPVGELQLGAKGISQKALLIPGESGRAIHARRSDRKRQRQYPPYNYQKTVSGVATPGPGQSVIIGRTCRTSGGREASGITVLSFAHILGPPLPGALQDSSTMLPLNQTTITLIMRAIPQTPPYPAQSQVVVAQHTK